ncbi:aldo/keto reductase [Algibacillus agarilyticus]|uniref:aldo/keto reductase n=1 Tax=Algibacillus agarilyticus TaxID=2234133 RepID=UPI000DD03070|nr:aldo/keto reductase [Algibacillus agarilyticus]
MKYKKLGSSPLMVSDVCLGTMTWGQQNTQEDANTQLDYAIEQGINFIDTAELYSVPPKAETQGSTERILGNWLAANKSKREDLIVASKITGPGLPWVREGSKVSGQSVIAAVEGSLARLQTDYIDLYQIHWPNRTSPHFSNHWPRNVDHTQVNVQQQRDEIADILQGLETCVKAGKIKYCGLSDETPWGINEYLKIAESLNLPSVVSIQNEFSLLHLKDSPYVIENCVLNDIAYLPWSPLAGGALSGKYRNNERPANCRWTMSQRNGIFRDTSQTHAAIEAYYQVAQKHGLALTQMALAWVYQFKGVTSTIIGATSMPQLQEDISAYHLALSEEVLADIDEVIKRYPVPF